MCKIRIKPFSSLYAYFIISILIVENTYDEVWVIKHNIEKYIEKHGITVVL